MSDKPSPSRNRRLGLVRWLGWGRLLLLPPMVGSIFLMWWSVKRLGPVEADIEKVSQSIAQLNLEIDSMEGNLKEAGGVKGIEDCFKLAKAELLPGRPGIEAWLKSVEEAALAQSLELNVAFGAPETRAITNHVMTLMPADLTIVPRTDLKENASAYSRVLNLADAISSSGYRVDLVQLDAVGGSNSIERAHMSLQLWSTPLQSDSP